MPTLNFDPSLRPSVILDTNVVLDWLVFGDPQVQAVRHAIESGALRWLATEPMKSELARVLAYPIVAARGVSLATVQQHWDRWVEPLPTPVGGAPSRCADPDDQKFLDLAYATQASWLLTRDRALLQLARRAAAWGVQVAPPSAWVPSQPPPQPQPQR